MSNEVFPALRGLKIDVQRSLTWPTTVHQSDAGSEVRVQVQPVPKWSWTLSFDFLVHDRPAGLTELQKLVGFWMRHRGSFEPFRYLDPDDNQVTDQPIGVGNGTRTTWQLARSFGGLGAAYRFDEPITEIGTASAKVDGVPVESTLGSGGALTLAAAPASGAVVTASASYWWRARFAEGSLDVQQWVAGFWRTKSIELVQVLQ